MLTTAKPFYRVLRAGLAAGVLATALAACGSTNWGFPYRPDIQQGNWITSEQVAQLKQGMTREQVRYILGTPTLQDIFHSNRWDYPYYNNPGYGEDQQRRFTVWFDGDSLTRWEGDKQPDRQPFQKADTGMQNKTAEDKAAAAAAAGQPAISGGEPAAGGGQPATESYALPAVNGSQQMTPDQATPAIGTGEPRIINNTITPDGASKDATAATDGSDTSNQASDQQQRTAPRRPLLNQLQLESRPDSGAPSAGRNTSEPLR